jgi:hypothetical protein
MVNDALVRYGSSKRVWWPDETPVQITVGSVPSTDIMVSHEAPLSFDPFLVRADYVRDEIWQKIVESRKYLDCVLRAIKPALWFYGHYHNHFDGVIQHDVMRQTYYCGLDIAEMTRVF